MYSHSYIYKYSFYKTLNVDSETMKTIVCYNYLKDKMLRDAKSINIEEDKNGND